MACTGWRPLWLVSVNLAAFIGSHFNATFINRHFIQHAINKLKGIRRAIGFSKINTFVNHHLVGHFNAIEQLIGGKRNTARDTGSSSLIFSIKVARYSASISARVFRHTEQNIVKQTAIDLGHVIVDMELSLNINQIRTAHIPGIQAPVLTVVAPSFFASGFDIS